MTCHTISFPGSRFPDVTVTAKDVLSQRLTPDNSPVLFGCRAGLCGTCAARISVVAGSLAAACSEEREALDVYAPGDPAARLLCQLAVTADIAIEPLGDKT